MKKLKFLVIAIAAVISTLMVQNAYALADNYEVSYTLEEPIVGETMPTTVTASIKIDGEYQGEQVLNLFWYETDQYQYSFKKATSTIFKPGKYYKPSVVDINFTTTEMYVPSHGKTYVENGPAYSNCSFMGKGTNIETGPSHLSNAFRCDYSLVEKINGESNKIFRTEREKIKEINITIDTEIAGIEAKKGSEWPCWYGEPGDVCYAPTIYPTVTLGDHYKMGDDGLAYYIVGLPEDGEGFDASFFGTFEEGKKYNIDLYVITEDGYEFDEDAVIKVNGKTTGFIERDGNTIFGKRIYATITATAKKAEALDYKVLKGNGGEFNPASNKPVSLEFDIFYAKFLESGKVFVDGNLVDPKNYDSKEGSTIITLKKEFTDTLSAGKHTITVAVADGESTGTFTILESEASTTETVPKTLDNIEWSVVVCAISAVALIGTAIYTKNKSFN